MDISSKLKVGFYSHAFSESSTTFQSYLKAQYDPYFRIFRMISEAMNFEFEAVQYDSIGKLMANGSWTGVIGMIGRLEADMSSDIWINEERKKVLHFSYPYRHYPVTFIVEKPMHAPQAFGMLKAFSLSAWLMFAVFTIVVIIAAVVLMKRRYSLGDILLGIFAICLGQSTTVKTWTVSQSVLTLIWMIGTMFLRFCYTSVLLSFLTFPFIFEIRDMRNLASAVENHGYNCMYNSFLISGPSLLLNSELKSFRTIGRHLQKNPNAFGRFEEFMRLKGGKNAYFTLVEEIPFLPNNYYISDDHILEITAGIPMRKDFCCKKKLDDTIHRIMAAGLYLKVKQDKVFLSGLKFRFEASQTMNERRLILSDFYLPFIILLVGYFISFLVLIAERKQSLLKNTKRK